MTGDGHNNEDLPEVCGEIGDFEWLVDNNPPCYVATVTPDDDPGVIFLTNFPKG